MIDVNDQEDGRHLIPLQSIALEGQFVCPLCSYKTGSKRNLERHREALHSEKNVTCGRSFCNEVFQTKFMMLQHFSNCFINCEWENCDKKFKYRKKYEAHQRHHITDQKRMY